MKRIGIIYQYQLDAPLNDRKPSRHYTGFCELGRLAERDRIHRRGVRYTHNQNGETVPTGAAPTQAPPPVVFQPGASPAAPTNGKPAAQPTQPPATPFDEDIRAATAAEFVPTVAAALELTTEAIRDRMAALGYHKISGKPDERVTMFHALMNYEPPAESAALDIDDPDAEAAALATAKGELT